MRDVGYYWIKFHGVLRTEIAYWTGADWMVVGSALACGHDHCCDVLSERIIAPGDPGNMPTPPVAEPKPAKRRSRASK